MKILKQHHLGATLAIGLGSFLAVPAGAQLFVTRPPINPAYVTTTPEQQAIIAKADALGRAFTGAPVSWLEAIPGGHRIRYQGCEIYYSPATGAHEVHGEIGAKYNAVGAATLGLPITDEQSVGGADLVGRVSVFSNGACILWHPTSGPMVLTDPFRGEWVLQQSRGAALGYPTKDRLAPFQLLNTATAHFQNGVLYAERGRGFLTPRLAELSREQVAGAVRTFFEKKARAKNSNLYVLSAAIRSVSDIGYSFTESRNRIVTFEIKGYYQNLLKDADYTITLPLLLYGQSEPEGWTLRVAQVGPAQISVYGLPGIIQEVRDGLAGEIRDTFQTPVNLSKDDKPGPDGKEQINYIPANELLGVKVMPDGALKLFFTPNAGSAYPVQQALLAAAGY